MNVPLLLVLTAWIWAAGPSSCPNGHAVGKIERVEVVDNQPIQIRKAGEQNWFRAEKGAELCAGDQVRTRYQTKGRIKLEARSKSRSLEVFLGVNTRVRTIGDWNSSNASQYHEPVLDVVHGVIRISFKGKDTEKFAVRTGPTLCGLRGEEVLSNWDPFKAEANHLVIDGDVVCRADSVVVEAHNGEWLEIVRGGVRPPREAGEMLSEVFRRATTLK